MPTRPIVRAAMSTSAGVWTGGVQWLRIRKALEGVACPVRSRCIGLGQNAQHGDGGAALVHAGLYKIAVHTTSGHVMTQQQRPVYARPTDDTGQPAMEE